MFQMALLLLKGNNCAKLFWNPCINVQIMLRTSSIHIFDHFDLYLTPVTLTFNLSKNVSNGTSPHKGNNCAKLSWNTCIIVQVLVRTKPDGRTDACTYTELNCNNYVSLTRKGAQQKCFKSHLLEDNNCANLFWNPIMNVQVMVTTNPMDAHTH